MIRVEVADQQSVLAVDQARIEGAVRRVLDEVELIAADISVAIVDDPTIHDLNRRYLDHDYATDVLSFVLEREPDRLEGEVIVSAETAAREGPGHGWQGESELLLYVIHGSLHLIGYDDKEPSARATMRQAETEHLDHWGLRRPSGQSSSTTAGEGTPR